jgi:hypothetical protein
MFLKNVPEPQRTEITKMLLEIDNLTKNEILHLKLLQKEFRKKQHFNQEILHSKRSIEHFTKKP